MHQFKTHIWLILSNHTDGERDFIWGQPIAA